jgi:hypothetical protein
MKEEKGTSAEFTRRLLQALEHLGGKTLVLKRSQESWGSDIDIDNYLLVLAIDRGAKKSQ